MANIKEVISRSTLNPTGEVAHATPGGGPAMPDAWGYLAKAADEQSQYFFERSEKLKAIERKLAEEKQKAFEDTQATLITGKIAAAIAQAESALKAQVVYDADALSKTVWDADTGIASDAPTGKIHYTQYAEKWREKTEEIFNAVLGEVKSPTLHDKVLKSAYPSAIAGYRTARAHQDSMEMDAIKGALKQNIQMWKTAASMAPDLKSAEAAIVAGEKEIDTAGAAIAPDFAEAAKIELRRDAFKAWSHEYARTNPQKWQDLYDDKTSDLWKHVDGDDLFATLDRLNKVAAEADKKNDQELRAFSDKWEKDVFTEFASGKRVSIADIAAVKEKVTREAYERVLSAKRTYEHESPVKSDEATMLSAIEDIALGKVPSLQSLLNRVRGKVTHDDLSSLVTKFNERQDRLRTLSDKAQDEAQKARDKAEQAAIRFLQDVFAPGGPFDFDRAMNQVRAMALDEFTRKVAADKGSKRDIDDIKAEVAAKYARTAVGQMNDSYSLGGDAKSFKPLIDPRYLPGVNGGSVEQAEKRLYQDRKEGRITEEDWRTQRLILDRVKRWDEIKKENRGAAK